MYSLYANDDDVAYGIQKFILDTEEDIKTLPTQVRAGSSALVIETSSVYVLNHQQQWIKIRNDEENTKTFLEWEAF